MMFDQHCLMCREEEIERELGEIYIRVMWLNTKRASDLAP